MTEEQALAEIVEAAKTHGPGIIDRMLELVRERAKHFPDRERQLNWTFVIRSGGNVDLEVRP